MQLEALVSFLPSRVYLVVQDQLHLSFACHELSPEGRVLLEKQNNFCQRALILEGMVAILQTA